MPNLILLVDPKTTTLADDAHKVTVVKFVGTKQEFVIRQLICAPYVVALESDLVEIFLLELVELLEVRVFRTLAWSREELGALRLLPLLDTRRAEVGFTTTALSALDDDIVAERAFEGLNQVTSTEL